MIFQVEGTPVGQPRVRHAAKLVARAGGLTVANFTYGDSKHAVNKYKADVREAFLSAMRGGVSSTTLQLPVRVTLTFVMPRPKKIHVQPATWEMVKKGRQVARVKSRPKDNPPEGRFPHLSTPDTDNLVKAFLDALKGDNGLGAWVDDSQVFSLRAEKWCAAKDEQPHTEAEIIWHSWEKLESNN